MSTPTVADQVERVLKPIQQFVRGWMTGAETDKRAKSLGLPSDTAFWIVGRAGVLGDGDSSVAAAGLAFLAPELVKEFWDHLPPDMTHHDVAYEYALMAHEWGAAELSRFEPERMERLDELGRRIANAADGSIGTVFAGTRALPQPTDVGSRVALTMHVLRELRGGAHIAALAACGLSPLEAIIVSPAPAPRSGPVWATHLGWTGPFPEATDERRTARANAEQLTSKILLPAYGSLSPSDLEEFAELITTTRNAIEM